jgi:NAD-dependent SIR2 family protein deacetylase
VFFGENIDARVRDASFETIDKSSSLLVVGSSLEVYSAFRLVKRAIDQLKPVIILNIGDTRAERDVANNALITKLEVHCSKVLPELASLTE